MSFTASYQYIMPCRQSALNYSLEGLKKSGIPLVEYSKSKYYASGFTDDLGIYYWVPKIAYYFNLDISKAYENFEVFLLGLSVCLSCCGIYLTFKDVKLRILTISVLLYSIFKWNPAFEVNYAAAFFSILSVVPLTIYFVKEKEKYRYFIFFLFFSGLLMGSYHNLRSYSFLATLAVISSLVLLSPYFKKKEKVTLFFSLIIGLSLPMMHYTYLTKQRDHFLYSQNNSVSRSNINHPFWHSAYIGLGFFENPFGVDSYIDTVADEAAKKIDPGVNYMSNEYENILKQLYFKKISENPKAYFFQLEKKIKIMFSKIPKPSFFWLSIFLIFCTTFAARKGFNILRASQQDVKLLTHINMAFLLGMGVALIPSTLVVPFPNYASDFFVLSFFYGVIGVILIGRLIDIYLKPFILRQI